MKYFVNTDKNNIKHLSNKKINNLKIDNNKISFETNDKSLKQLLNSIQELSYINKRKKRIISFFKKYCISILSILILIVFIINEQFVIKEIKFINENTYSEEVKNYIYENHLNKKLIYYYLNKPLNEINNDLKSNFFYYEWINVNKKGNRLQVIIDKQDEKSYLNENSKVIGDIISTHDGIIRYYFIKKGVNLIKDNQSIKKGEILVSGNLLIKNEKIKYIHPVGIVLAEVVETENIKIKKESIDYVKTGKVKSLEKVSFFIINNLPKIPFDIYEEKKKTIFDFKIIIKEIYTFYEIQEIKNHYTLEEAMEYSISIIEKNFNENKIHNKEKILETYLLKYYEDDYNYYFKYYVKKIINISEFKAVNLEEN